MSSMANGDPFNSNSHLRMVCISCESWMVNLDLVWGFSLGVYSWTTLLFVSFHTRLQEGKLSAMEREQSI